MHVATALAQTDPYQPAVAECCPLLAPDQRFELLHLHLQQDSTEAIFLSRHDSLITSQFPGFEKKLLNLLPGLLDNVQCFNGSNHNFATEMLATEMGHLFEHIWLEVLCCEKLKIAQVASYSGETNWNWHEDPLGLFRISITAGMEDRQIVERSAWISSVILQKCLED